MTVIAFKNGVLAADKRSVNHSRPTTVTKIFRVGNGLAAISGDLVKGLEIIEWIKAGRVAADLPGFQRSQDDYVPVLLVSKEGFYLFENSPIPFRIEEPIFAMGSGRDYALMAMHLGLSASDAVEQTCKLTSCCGNGIDTLAL